MRLFFVILLIFNTIFFTKDLSSQEIDTTRFNALIDKENFQQSIIADYLIYKINEYRTKKGFDSLSMEPILRNVSEDHASYMAYNGELSEFQKGKKKTLGKRLQFYGGSEKAEQLIIRASISRGRDAFSYKEVGNEIFFKWYNDAKTLDIIANPAYSFYGVGGSIDEGGRRLYLTMTLSNYQIFNTGAHKRDELSLPYTKKKYGLKPYDNRACRRCERFRNIEGLHNGIYLQGNDIYFKSDKVQDLRRILKGSGDGLAIDIVLKEQFPCNGPNIIDYNRVNKGYMLKMVKAPKLFAKNTIKDRRESKRKINVKIGTLPKNLPEHYEMNLLIIQDKHVCRSITKTFINEGSIVYSDAIELLADTVIIGKSEYIPTAETANLNFRIPFERNKAQYRPEDIEPFLKKLREPDFIINNIEINAFSSVEGTDATNKSLQTRRAESIVSALKSRQQDDFVSSIKTGDNIEDFKRDVKGTEFEKMANMSISEIQNHISSNRLHKKMEPILANHRYADIKMQITYDISGKKEELFVLNRFNKSIEENDLVNALSIQKFIFRKVMKGEYSQQAVFGQEIPEKPEYAGLLMNKLWLSGLLMNKLWLEKFIKNEDINEEYCDRIDYLYNMSPDNAYIKFNWLYCKIINESFNDENKIIETQKLISELYATQLRKETIDKLNLEYQFKIIQTLDTTETPHPLLLASLDTIKAIIDVKETNWQNALKMANVFTRYGDYNFAVKMIEPYIKNKHVFEELLFTYIGLSSFSGYRMYTRNFTIACQKAAKMNKERFCSLIKDKVLSIQIFENPDVKKIYCESCTQ